MAKIAKPMAALVIVSRKRRECSAQFAASLHVTFLDLRPSMCRWPIGDPQQVETFRFCGSACPVEAAYCKKHNAIAHVLNRPPRLRGIKFKKRSPVSVA